MVRSPAIFTKVTRLLTYILVSFRRSFRHVNTAAFVPRRGASLTTPGFVAAGPSRVKIL